MLFPELGARYMGVFSEVHQALSSTCYSSITVVLWIETLQSQNQRCNWLGQGKPFSPSFSECFAELVSSPRNSLLLISHAFLTQQSCGRPALGNLGTVPCEEVEREPRDLRPAPQAQAKQRCTTGFGNQPYSAAEPAWSLNSQILIHQRQIYQALRNPLWVWILALLLTAPVTSCQAPYPHPTLRGKYHHLLCKAVSHKHKNN